jgi:protoporphyrinogen oxidase
MGNKGIILGAGIAGLSAGIASGAEVFEGGPIPGGICASHYINPKGGRSFRGDDAESYRFEIGGGHWIFGADAGILDFINSFSPVKSYKRRSSVYLPGIKSHIPYPIQNHLKYLPEDIRKKALDEIINGKGGPVSTLADWLELNFGRTLCELFFFPFHELYTAGLYKETAPQDAFKSPVNKDLIVKGAEENTKSVGYNAIFAYPAKGLDDLIRNMAKKCRINFNKRVVKIDVKSREIFFADGKSTGYGDIVSTLPLNRMIEMTGLDTGIPDPFTSVLVINIGALTGGMCPDEQWVYVPKSRAGFHRVGFYSNVDPSFLPVSSRADGGRVSIYVEKAYPGGKKPSDVEIQRVCDETVKELKEWSFISQAEVVDPTWIDVAYTWQRPHSSWVEEAIGQLKDYGIHQTGRYGRWKFQGIAESIKDGIDIKAALNG